MDYISDECVGSIGKVSLMFLVVWGRTWSSSFKASDIILIDIFCEILPFNWADGLIYLCLKSVGARDMSKFIGKSVITVSFSPCN